MDKYLANNRTTKPMKPIQEEGTEHNNKDDSKQDEVSTVVRQLVDEVLVDEVSTQVKESLNPKVTRFTYLDPDLPPWESLYRQGRETRVCGLTEPFNVGYEKREFDVERLPSVSKVVEKQFRGTRKLGSTCYQWIFYEATQGLIRSDKNKQVWVSSLFRKKGAKPWTQSQRIHLRKRLNKLEYWTVEDREGGFNLIEEVTRRCNEIHSELLMHLATRRQTRTVKQRLLNIRELPDFVNFQTYRKTEHSRYRWEFAPTPQGGNNDCLQAERPVKVKVNSVHALMLHYHNWLGKFRVS